MLNRHKQHTSHIISPISDISGQYRAIAYRTGGTTGNASSVLNDTVDWYIVSTRLGCLPAAKRSKANTDFLHCCSGLPVLRICNSKITWNVAWSCCNGFPICTTSHSPVKLYPSKLASLPSNLQETTIEMVNEFASIHDIQKESQCDRKSLQQVHLPGFVCIQQVRLECNGCGIQYTVNISKRNGIDTTHLGHCQWQRRLCKVTSSADSEFCKLGHCLEHSESLVHRVLRLWKLKLQ